MGLSAAHAGDTDAWLCMVTAMAQARRAVLLLPHAHMPCWCGAGAAAQPWPQLALPRPAQARLAGIPPGFDSWAALHGSAEERARRDAFEMRW